MHLRSCTSSVNLSFYIKEMTNKKVPQTCSSGRGFPKQRQEFSGGRVGQGFS